MGIISVKVLIICVDPRMEVAFTHLGNQFSLIYRFFSLLNFELISFSFFMLELEPKTFFHEEIKIVFVFVVILYFEKKNTLN